MKMTLKTLSPLHIGTDEVLDPFDYFIYQGKLRVINHNACLEALYAVDEKAPEKFGAWIESTSARIAGVEQEARNMRTARNFRGFGDKNQLLAKLRSGFSIITFCEKELGQPELAKRFRDDKAFHRYEAECLSLPKNLVQVKQTLKSGGKAYVPGSSIKGALRTALAYTVISELDETETAAFLAQQDYQSQGLEAVLNQLGNLSGQLLMAIKANRSREIEEKLGQLNRERYRFERRIGEEVDKYVFGGNKDPQEKPAKPHNEAQHDLLRIVKVRDTRPLRDDNSLLAAELKSVTWHQRDEKMAAQPVAIAECVAEGVAFDFDISIDAQLIRMLFGHLADRTKIKEKEPRWIRFEETFERLFGFGRETVDKVCSELVIRKDGRPDDFSRADEELQRLVIERILQATRTFALAILQKEHSWLEQFPDHNTRKPAATLEAVAQAASPLKLGFAAGWFATTVGLALANNEAIQRKGLLEKVIYGFNLDLTIRDQRLMRFPGKGERDIARQIRLLERSGVAVDFPKSRRMLLEDSDKLLFLGWASLGQ